MEVAIALVARDGLQTHRRPIESACVALGVGNADERASIVERPGMIEALERLRGALVTPADDRAAVGARVVEHADLIVAATDEHERTAADGATPVFAWLSE